MRRSMNQQRSIGSMAGPKRLSVTVVAATTLLWLGTVSILHAKEIGIVRVVPSKILYDQGADATGAIVVRSFATVERHAELVVVEQRGLDEQVPVYKGNLSLAPGETKAVQVAWNVGPRMWGRGLKASVLVDGAVVSERTEFYHVADDWWRVALLNVGGTAREPTGRTEKRKLLEYHGLPVSEENLRDPVVYLDNDLEGMAPFMSYGNFIHWFAWAPSDFGELTPDVDAWYSGQGGFGMNKGKMMGRIAKAKAFGMKCSAYTANYPGGPAGFEFARQHPEWILRTASGSFATVERPVSPLDMAKPITERPSTWCAVNVDGYWPEAIAFGAEELAASSRMFGWDAWYFDYHYVMQPGWSWDGQETPHGEDPASLSARNVRLVRDIVLKESPRTFFWQNGGSRSIHKFTGFWGNHGGKEGRLAMLEHPQNGTLQEFQGGQLADPNCYIHHWRTLFEVFLAERDARMLREEPPDISGTVQLTGYMYNENFYLHMSKEAFAATRDEWTLSNHFASLLLAVNYHPCWLGTWSFRPAAQFITRYSEFLWDPAMEVVEYPADRIEVDCLREVWWEECVYVRESEDHTDTMIHLINAPVSESADIKASEDPPAVDDVELYFQIGNADPERFEVWAFRPHSYDAAVREPVQTRLRPVMQDGSLMVEVPPFHYYTLVVIRQRP